MKKIYLICLFLVTNFISQAQDKIEKIIVELKPYNTICYGAFFKSTCLQTIDNQYIDRIENFEFDWGYDYKLQLKKTTLEKPMQDVSNLQYELIKVKSKKKTDFNQTFDLFIHKNSRLDGLNESPLKSINDTTYLYFDKLNIVVPKDKKQNFEEKLAEKLIVKHKFKFLDINKIILVE
jgi:hypothetical protein